MTSDGSSLPSLSTRLDTLFRVWLTPEGAERPYREVACELQQFGLDATADDVQRWRTGEASPQDDDLVGLARVFPGDANLDYLTSDARASAVHAQLALVLELVEGRVKDIRLRSEHEDIDRQELTKLLKQLREHRAAT